MKKQSLIIVFVFVSLALFLGACHSGKKLAKVENQEKIVLPFSSSNYRTDDRYFRFVQSHESTDLSLAKTRAIMKAQIGLAGTVEVLLKAVMDNYTGERKIKLSEMNDKYNEISQLVLYRNLKNTHIIGEEAYVNKADKNYTYWVAIEVNSNDIYSDLVKGISSTDKLRQDFDEAKFREIYNEEIRKKEAEQTKIQYNAVQ